MATPISTEITRKIAKINRGVRSDENDTSMMEHGGCCCAPGADAARATVQEEHLPGAGARRVEDEPAGLHANQSFKIELARVSSGETKENMYSCCGGRGDLIRSRRRRRSWRPSCGGRSWCSTEASSRSSSETAKAPSCTPQSPRPREISSALRGGDHSCTDARVSPEKSLASAYRSGTIQRGRRRWVWWMAGLEEERKKRKPFLDFLMRLITTRGLFFTIRAVI